MMAEKLRYNGRLEIIYISSHQDGFMMNKIPIQATLFNFNKLVEARNSTKLSPRELNLNFTLRLLRVTLSATKPF